MLLCVISCFDSSFDLAVSLKPGLVEGTRALASAAKRWAGSYDSRHGVSAEADQLASQILTLSHRRTAG